MENPNLHETTKTSTIQSVTWWDTNCHSTRQKQNMVFSIKGSFDLSGNAATGASSSPELSSNDALIDWNEIRGNLESGSTSWNVEETFGNSGMLEANGTSDDLYDLMEQVTGVLTGGLFPTNITIRVSVSPEETTIEIKKQIGWEYTLQWTIIRRNVGCRTLNSVSLHLHQKQTAAPYKRHRLFMDCCCEIENILETAMLSFFHKQIFSYYTSDYSTKLTTNFQRKQIELDLLSVIELKMLYEAYILIGTINYTSNFVHRE